MPLVSARSYHSEWGSFARVHSDPIYVHVEHSVLSCGELRRRGSLLKNLSSGCQRWVVGNALDQTGEELYCETA